MDKEKLNQTKVIKPPTRDEIKGIIISLIKAIGNFAGVLFVGGIFYTFYDSITNNGERTLQPFARFVKHTVIPFITNISSYIPWLYIRLTIIIWIFLIVAEMVIGRYLDIETKRQLKKSGLLISHEYEKTQRRLFRRRGGFHCTSSANLCDYNWSNGILHTNRCGCYNLDNHSVCTRSVFSTKRH